MKKNNFYFLIILQILCIFEIGAQPFFNRPKNDNCNTTGKYNSQTRVTFYGDSRMDYAQLYSPGNMDFFLGASGWNVQNFGQSAEDSVGLLSHLKTCLNRTNYPAYKIHQNVAFHIGGNDFGRRVSGALMTMPWLFPSAVAQVRDNNERIVSLLQRTGRRVLLIGHYPTLANSRKIGKYTNYYPMYNPKATLPWEHEPPTASANWYIWWTNIFADPATVASLGMMFLEPLLADIKNRRSGMYGRSVEYTKVWDAFTLKLLLDEPWLAEPALITNKDGMRVHPSFVGLRVWGDLVSAKLRALGWEGDPFSVEKQCTEGVSCGDPNQNTTKNCEEGDDACSTEPADPAGCDALCLLILCAATGKCW